MSLPSVSIYGTKILPLEPHQNFRSKILHVAKFFGEESYFIFLAVLFR